MKDRLPPHDDRLEAAVLGAVMLGKDEIYQIVGFLQPDHFYDERHAEIYAAMGTIFDEGQGIDVLTVTARLRSASRLEAAGGPAFITGLTTRVDSTYHLEQHARLLVELAIKRKMIRLGMKIMDRGYEVDDAFDQIAYVDQEVEKIANQVSEATEGTTRELMMGVIKELEEPDAKRGVMSSFPDLDKVIHGWRSGDLIILASRPGMGKTSLALALARNAAIDFEVPVVVYSLEMPKVQLMQRLASMESNINLADIRNGRVFGDMMQQLIQLTSQLTDAPIFIDDASSLNITRLRTRASRLKRKHGIGLIVVDYLQLMSSRGKLIQSREQEISTISRGLKGLAKDLNVPVICLSQLSRAVEQRGGVKRPVLSDLRDSGSIEQDADIVGFLYRPEYYDIKEDADGNSTDGLCELIIAKNRNGPLRTVKLKFLGGLTKFASWMDDWKDIVTKPPTDG